MGPQIRAAAQAGQGGLPGRRSSGLALAKGALRTQGVMGQLGLGLSLRGSGQPGWWAEAALAPPCLPAPSPAVPSALLLAWPGLRPPPQGFAEPLIHPGRQ